MLCKWIYIVYNLLRLVPVLNIFLRFVLYSVYQLSSGRYLLKFFPLVSQNMLLFEKRVPVAVITQAHMGTEQETFMSNISIRTESQRRALCEDKEHRESRGCLKMGTVIEVMLP